MEIKKFTRVLSSK